MPTMATVGRLLGSVLLTAMLVGAIAYVDNRFLFAGDKSLRTTSVVMLVMMLAVLASIALVSSKQTGEAEAPWVGLAAWLGLMLLVVHPRLIQLRESYLKFMPVNVATAAFVLAWVALVLGLNWGHLWSERALFTYVGGAMVLLSMRTLVDDVYNAATAERATPMHLPMGTMGIGWFLVVFGASLPVPGRPDALGASGDV